MCLLSNAKANYKVITSKEENKHILVHTEFKIEKTEQDNLYHLDSKKKNH
jgi:hypothetical protein